MINTNKAVSTIIDHVAVTQAHLAATRQQMATRPVQEVKETIMREVLTSAKVQETVGKILNKVV